MWSGAENTVAVELPSLNEENVVLAQTHVEELNLFTGLCSAKVETGDPHFRGDFFAFFFCH